MKKLGKRQVEALKKNPLLFRIYNLWLVDDALDKATKKRPECYTGSMTRRRYRAGQTIEEISGYKLDYHSCVELADYMAKLKAGGKRG